MSRDWERWLRDSAGPPPKKEDAKRIFTEQSVKAAVAGHPALSSLPLAVFAKGSFANRTNISLESDVDVVVECGDVQAFFYYDIAPGVDYQPWQLGILPREPPCTPIDLKQWVYAALVNAFGQESVTPSGKALRVRSGRARIAADVVPAFRYHRYVQRYGEAPGCLSGHLLFSDSGVAIVNWPAQHYEQGVAKNEPERTGRRFKQMVRALKRLAAELRQAGVLHDSVSSFFIESLVFNAPDPCFGHDRYVDDMQAVLTHIFNATIGRGAWSQWVEVNCVKPLFGDGQGWTWQQANDLAVLAHRAMVT